MSSDLADTAATPAVLIERLRGARATADWTEVEVLQLAVAWAHAHPVLDEHGIEVTWQVVPSAIWQPGEYDASVAHSDGVEGVGGVRSRRCAGMPRRRSLRRTPCRPVPGRP